MYGHSLLDVSVQSLRQLRFKSIAAPSKLRSDPCCRHLQVYVRGRASLDARVAAEEAFLQHCSDSQAPERTGGHAALQPTLFAPSAWPFSPLLVDWSSSSELATVARDASLMEGYLDSLLAGSAQLDKVSVASIFARPQQALSLPASFVGRALSGATAASELAEFER